MKRFYTLLLLTSFHLNLKAQLTPSDSLQVAFDRATSDTAKLSILLKNRYVKYLGEPDKAIALYQQGFDIAQRLNDKRIVSKMAYNIGATYSFGKTDDGLAFQWFQKALEVSEQVNDYEGCESTLYAMGIVYEHQGYPEKKYEAFLRALSYSEKITKPSIKPLTALISSYFSDNRFEEALAIAKKGIAMIDRFDATAFNKLYLYGSLRSVLKLMPSRKQELNSCEDKMVAILNKMDIVEQPDELVIVIELCLEDNRTDLAIKYINRLLSMKDEGDIVYRCKTNAHKYLAQIYESQKNYPLSIQEWKQYTKMYIDITEKTVTQESGRKVIKAEAERDIAIKQKEIEQHKLYTLLTSVVAFLVLVLGGVAYYFYRREQKQKKELIVLNATKDKLFALISHDLISPVDTLKNYTILMDWGAMTQETFAESLQRFKTTLSNTSNMLENVLHWAVTQMDGMTPKRENVNVSEVLKEQIALVEPMANDKKIQIQQSITTDVQLNMDKNHLALILRNVLQNALKFTNKGGTIRFSYQNTEGGKRIRIEDNGIGMTPEIRAQLFQIDKNTQRTGTSEEKGTGLGLILTKELVELNGGQVDVLSEVGKGTIFTLAFS